MRGYSTCDADVNLIKDNKAAFAIACGDPGP
jgi:hypothetical protein